MTTRQRFENKVAIITGASRGIGFAIAQQLASEGARVVLTARAPEALQAAVDSFPAGQAIGIPGNSDDPKHRAAVMDRVATECGRLDVLINNAGINPVYGPLEDLEHAAARKVLEVNVIGTLAWTQQALKHEGLGFRSRNGSIVNISSAAADVPTPGIGLYGISKAAVSHLTHTLAAELGPEIRVNAVAPAVVKTKFATALYDGREEEVAQEYPMKRLGTPEDIATVVAFLASADASWVTGQVVNVDGGLVMAGGTM